MAGRSNPITIFLNDERYMNLSIYARKHGLNLQSLRNTICGIKPIRKVCQFLYIEDKEIFDMLPKISQEIITKPKKKVYYW